MDGIEHESAGRARHIKAEIKDEAAEETEYVYTYDDANEDDDAVSYISEAEEAPPAEDGAKAEEDEKLAKIKYRKKMIHGTNPQFLIEKILRERIYESIYCQKAQGERIAATLLEKAVDLKFIGGDWGQQRPTNFICLVLKLLKLQPDEEIVLAYLHNRDFKYIRALGAFYLRLTGSSATVYAELEPLLKDRRKLRIKQPDGSVEITYMDAFVDELLTEERVLGTQLPRLLARHVLVEMGDLAPRISPMQYMIDGSTPPPEEVDEQEETRQEEADVVMAAHAPSEADTPRTPWRVGLCAMSTKSKSKAMLAIMERLQRWSNCEFVDFPDDMLLHEPIEKWPTCQFLIAFFSAGFPLEKAIAYYNLRRPICINDLSMQKLLLDRRLMLNVLHHMNIATPRHYIVTRDGGPTLDEDVRAKFCKHMKLANFPNALPQYEMVTQIDENTIQIGPHKMKKPFLEKPVDGEDHNIYIYYPGGGVRKLFRKVKDQSSEFVPDVWQIRTSGSYIYEEFLTVDNAEDVKVYTVGPYRFHAETRRSPVVDGVVLRNKEGKELRYQSELSPSEKEIARKVCTAFDQTVCGFDLLRVGGESYVIDVNGWSFVKGNEHYYELCASTLFHIFNVIGDRNKTVFTMSEEEFNHLRPAGLPSPARGSGQ